MVANSSYWNETCETQCGRGTLPDRARALVRGGESVWKRNVEAPFLGVHTQLERNVRSQSTNVRSRLERSARPELLHSIGHVDCIQQSGNSRTSRRTEVSRSVSESLSSTQRTKSSFRTNSSMASTVLREIGSWNPESHIADECLSHEARARGLTVRGLQVA